MNTLYIEHNPFKNETLFKINEKQPASTCFLSESPYSDKTLQFWIEGLFSEVYEKLFNSTPFNLTFKGVEADFLDVQEAREFFKQKTGIDIDVQWIQVNHSNEQRLNLCKELVNKLKKHHLFKNENIEKRFENAFGKDFHIYVIAPMSSGKSTFINSLLGMNLLPAQNKATTATIFEIKDNKSFPRGSFKGARLIDDDKIAEISNNVDCSLLAKWNDKTINGDTQQINLEGNFLGIKEREEVRLVITDTPGPNNSNDTRHALVTRKKIEDLELTPLIFYVLNARSLGIQDDKTLLETVSKFVIKHKGKQYKERFVFLLNQADALDAQKGESIDKTIEDCKNYIEGFGIKNPLILPISAQAAYVLRAKEAGYKLTEDEDIFLYGWNKKAQKINYTDFMPLSSAVIRKLNQQKLSPELLSTGIPAVEAFIDQYIEKYHFSNRIARIYGVLHSILEEFSEKSKLTKNLDHHRADLKEIRSTLTALSNEEKLANETQVSIKKLIEESKNDKNRLSLAEPIKELNQARAKVLVKLNELQNKLKDTTVAPEEAKKKLSKINEELKECWNNAVYEADKLHGETQNNIKKALHEIYRSHVAQHFSGKDIHLPLPMLEGLQKVMRDNTVLNLKVTEKDIKSSYYVKRNVFWYKPWTWFDEDEKITEKSVNLEKLWEKNDQELRANFGKLFEDMTNQLESDIETLIVKFSKFITKEFAEKLSSIAKDLETKTSSEERLHKAIRNAENDLKEIESFNKDSQLIINLDM